MATEVLAEDARRHLAARANRLDRLCQLKAPTIILRNEVALILQALEQVIQQEDPRQGRTELIDNLRNWLRGEANAHSS